MTEDEFVHHHGWREMGNKTHFDLAKGCIAIVVHDVEGYRPDYHECHGDRMALRGPYLSEEGARRFLYNLGQKPHHRMVRGGRGLNPIRPV